MNILYPNWQLGEVVCAFFLSSSVLLNTLTCNCLKNKERMGETWLVLMDAVKEMFKNRILWVGPMQKALIAWTEISLVPEVSSWSPWSHGSVGFMEYSCQNAEKNLIKHSPFSFALPAKRNVGLQWGSRVFLLQQCLFLSYSWIMCGLCFWGM